MATKARTLIRSRIQLTKNTKMTNYRKTFDDGKVEGHLDL